MLNNFKHYQKNSIRDRYKPISKNTKTLNLYSIILKVNNSGAAKVEYLMKKKNYKYKNPITNNIHACTPSSITHLDVYNYKNYIQIGRLLRNRRGFRDRVLHLTLSRSDNSILTPRYWFPILFSLSVVLKYK